MNKVQVLILLLFISFLPDRISAKSNSFYLGSVHCNARFTTEVDSFILNLATVSNDGIVETVVKGKDYLSRAYEFAVKINGETYSAIIQDEVAFVFEIITDIPLYRERSITPKYKKVYDEIKLSYNIDLDNYDDEDMIMIVFSQTCLNTTFYFVKLNR